jgi:hypothetical protein
MSSGSSATMISFQSLFFAFFALNEGRFQIVIIRILGP